MKRATHYRLQQVAWTDISIHALVKRATLLSGAKYARSVISIHALVKRATTVFLI